MPKKISQIEFDVVFQAVAGFPKGGSIKEISDALKVFLPRRTLQRRLAQLVKQNQLIIEGRGRGSCYRLPSREVKVRSSLGEFATKGQVPQVDNYIAVSSEGEAIKQAVREPIQKRRPVGHNRVFLDEYRPNDTFYLSPEVQQHLSELARILHEWGGQSYRYPI